MQNACTKEGDDEDQIFICQKCGDPIAMKTRDSHSDAGCARIAQLKRRIERAEKQIQQIEEKQAKELDANDSDQPQQDRCFRQVELEDRFRQSLGKADANKIKILEIREGMSKKMTEHQKNKKQNDK